MKKIEWTPKISVKEKTIDKQHQRLLAQIQKLMDDVLDESELKKVRDTFHFLYLYIKEHLKYEENYMKMNDYPGFKNHKKIHENFIIFFEKFKKDFYERLYSKPKPGELITSRLNELSGECREFLGKWWINHISIVDQKYAEYIDKKKSKSKKMRNKARKIK